MPRGCITNDDRWGTSQFDYDSNDQITRSASGGMMVVEERFRYYANLNIREQSRLLRGAMSAPEQVQQRQARGRVVSRGDGYERLSELMTPSESSL